MVTMSRAASPSALHHCPAQSYLQCMCQLLQGLDSSSCNFLPGDCLARNHPALLDPLGTCIPSPDCHVNDDEVFVCWYISKEKWVRLGNRSSRKNI